MDRIVLKMRPGAAVSVNGLRYRIIINEFLWPKLEDMDVNDVYFQQDSASCHTNGETIGLLREKFPGRVISQTAITIGFRDHAI